MANYEDFRVIRLGRFRSERFAGMAHTQSPHLTYYNGALLTNVEVFTVFWGGAWEDQPALVTLAGKLNEFFNFIVTSSLIDQLAEYSVPGKTIGQGKWIGTKTISTSPGSVIDDSSIQATLQQWLGNEPSMPQPNGNIVYFIYLPPGTSVTLGTDSSCLKFGGYHNVVAGKNISYAVEPFCLSDGGVLGQLDFLTLTSSHELCEAITDPVPGQGWYWFKDKKNQGEIGDICESAPNAEERIGGFLVQREWSNKSNGCV